MYAPPNARTASALPLLFAYYVSGTMAQHQWDRLAATLDGTDASYGERNAFAHFCLEMVSAGEAVELPHPDEAGDLFEAIRY